MPRSHIAAGMEGTKALERRIEPYRIPSGEWRSFAADCTETAAKGVEGTWRHSPWRAVLTVQAAGIPQSVTLDMDGEGHVTGCISILPEAATAREAARFLNARRLKPARRSVYRLRYDQPLPALCHAKGRWRHAGSEADLAAVLAPKAAGAVPAMPIEDAECVFALVAAGRRSAPAERLLAGALAAWAAEWRRTRDDLPLFAPEPLLSYLGSLPWHATAAGRLAAAAGLADRFGPATVKALSRIAAAALSVTARRPRGRARYFEKQSRLEATVRLVEDWHASLPDEALARALKFIGSPCGALRGPGGRLPGPAWHGPILARAGARPVRLPTGPSPTLRPMPVSAPTRRKP